MWFEGYEKTYLDRDVSRLRRIEDLAGFRRLTRLAALRLAGVLTYSGQEVLPLGDKRWAVPLHGLLA